MWWLLLLFVALAVPIHASQEPADEHIVLEPLDANFEKPERLLLLLPGDGVPNQYYVATARAVQAAAKEVRLWAVVPAIFGRRCVFSCPSPALCFPLRHSTEAAISLARDRGWNSASESQDVWLAGHSLGGTCANNLFQAYHTSSSTPYAGVIMLGSFVEEAGDYDLTHYPKPVLILTGELDGGAARPGKTATWWRQYLQYEAENGPTQAVREKAVIVLPKLNHSNFCPGFDLDFDLEAEVGQATASAHIGATVAAYLEMQTDGVSWRAQAAARVAMLKRVEWTRQLLSPYLLAQDFEWMATDTRASSKGASPFCAEAQRLITGLSQADHARFDATDGFHTTEAGLEFCEPDAADEQSRLTVKSCSHTHYFQDMAERGRITAASEIACKMLTGENVARRLNTTQENPNVDCKAINVYAVQVAESLASPFTLDRYRRRGRGFCFQDDAPVHLGLWWAFLSPLQEVESADCLSVASPAMKVPIDSWIFPSTYYCKFLSPARVLDWMMTDSLRPSKPAQQPGKAKWVWA